MSNPLTPQTISSNGVITATDANGVTHHFHTDADEAQSFFRSVQAFAAGREELGLLCAYQGDPTIRMRRQMDGRSDEQLKADWLSKVMAAGISREAALQFLEARLAC